MHQKPIGCGRFASTPRLFLKQRSLWMRIHIEAMLMSFSLVRTIHLEKKVRVALLVAKGCEDSYNGYEPWCTYIPQMLGTLLVGERL